MDQNLYWSPGCGVSIAGKLLESGEEKAFSLRDWQKKRFDQHSVMADPRFLDPEGGNFNVADGSPALALGFKPLPKSRSFALSAPAAKEVQPILHTFDFYGASK
jgi:hypothetical protein